MPGPMRGYTVALFLLCAYISRADINQNIKESDLLNYKAIEVSQRKFQSRVVIPSSNAKTECLTVDYAGVIVTAQRTNTVNPKEG